MIFIKRIEIIQKLSAIEIKNISGHNNLVKDILEREGDQTMAFLVKKGVLEFSKKELEEELNFMVENSLITIGQWEQMLELLRNAQNGKQRITNFLRKKRRFQVL
jgi:hypothetical protein